MANKFSNQNIMQKKQQSALALALVMILGVLPERTLGQEVTLITGVRAISPMSSAMPQFVLVLIQTG
ncbi:MAG: hypothetical protein MPJ50_14975 [Pirellulales bacterium]|nr:hypothetical protein [Pirellulales bacterium]